MMIMMMEEKAKVVCRKEGGREVLMVCERREEWKARPLLLSCIVLWLQ